MLKHIDEDQLAHHLGGSLQGELIDDIGPWNDYEIVDGHKPSDVVGIKKKGDAAGKVFSV